MELLLTGMSYNELPDTYVIFICDFDPFGEGKYRYTKKSICKELPTLEMDDGAYTIFLSTMGTNEDEVPKELVKDERIEERCQVIIELLEELGNVPENLITRIYQEKEMNTLKNWCKLVAKCTTVDEFVSKM